MDAPIPPPHSPPKRHRYKNIESCKLRSKESQQKSTNQFWVSRNKKIEMMMIMKMMMMRATVVAIQRCCINLFSESSSSEINPKPLDSPDLPPATECNCMEKSTLVCLFTSSLKFKSLRAGSGHTNVTGFRVLA